MSETTTITVEVKGEINIRCRRCGVVGEREIGQLNREHLGGPMFLQSWSEPRGWWHLYLPWLDEAHEGTSLYLCARCSVLVRDAIVEALDRNVP